MVREIETWLRTAEAVDAAGRRVRLLDVNTAAEPFRAAGTALAAASDEVARRFGGTT
jgi:hypothetical protein